MQMVSCVQLALKSSGRSDGEEVHAPFGGVSSLWEAAHYEDIFFLGECLGGTTGALDVDAR